MADSILDKVSKMEEDRNKAKSVVEAVPVSSYQTEDQGLQHAVRRVQELGSQIDPSIALARQMESAKASLAEEEQRRLSQTKVMKDIATETVSDLRSDIAGKPVVESLMQKAIRFFRHGK